MKKKVHRVVPSGFAFDKTVFYAGVGAFAGACLGAGIARDPDFLDTLSTIIMDATKNIHSIIPEKEWVFDSELFNKTETKKQPAPKKDRPSKKSKRKKVKPFKVNTDEFMRS